MPRSFAILVSLSATGVLLLPLNAAAACTLPAPTGCEPVSFSMPSASVPQNAPSILVSGSRDLSGQYEDGSHWRISGPDGGVILGESSVWPNTGVIIPVGQLEVGSGYLLRIEEHCVDGGWVADGGVMIDYPFEVTPALPEPTAVGELVAGASEELTVKEMVRGANCQDTEISTDMAQAQIRFTPDPSLHPWLARTMFTVWVDDQVAQYIPLGAVPPEGTTLAIRADCSKDYELGDHVLTIAPGIPAISSEFPFSASVQYRLECPSKASGCSSVPGAASAALIAAALLLWQRRKSRR